MHPLGGMASNRTSALSANDFYRLQNCEKHHGNHFARIKSPNWATRHFFQSRKSFANATAGELNVSGFLSGRDASTRRHTQTKDTHVQTHVANTPGKDAEHSQWNSVQSIRLNCLFSLAGPDG